MLETGKKKDRRNGERAEGRWRRGGEKSQQGGGRGGKRGEGSRRREDAPVNLPLHPHMLASNGSHFSRAGTLTLTLGGVEGELADHTHS